MENSAEPHRDSISKTVVSKVVSVGDISKVEIPLELPYARALARIKEEARGTGVTINVQNFYSETPIELHNFVSSITYRFIDKKGEKAIAYVIEDRDLFSCHYFEINYHGETVFTFSDELLRKPNKTESDKEIIRHANRVLGKYAYILASL